VPLSLSSWQTFYVITGSSGAALTGLMFVVVALAAERRQRVPADGLGAFSTPTVTHFASVLLLAGIMTIPVHRVLSLSICLGGCGAVGLLSTSMAAVRMRRLEAYSAVKEDWAWHVILPFTAYLALFASALVLGASRELALVAVAVVVLTLLIIGIHNAWDVAVFLALEQIEERAIVGAAGTSSPTPPAPRDLRDLAAPPLTATAPSHQPAPATREQPVVAADPPEPSRSG
jgi:hypothetical protein